MKRTLIAFVLAAGPAFAAAPFDGVYQIPGTLEYLSVHEKDGNVLVAQYYTLTGAPGSAYTILQAQRVVPQRTDAWDLLSGTVRGSPTTILVTGQVAFGACTLTMRIDFATLDLTPTNWFGGPLAASQGIDCALYGAAIEQARGGRTVRLVRHY